MSNSEDNQHNFPHSCGGQYYLLGKGTSLASSHLHSPGGLSGNDFLHASNSKINRMQQKSLSANNERSPPVFLISPNLSSQNDQTQQPLADYVYNSRCSVDSIDNVSPPSEDTNYISLTSWTTKFSNQGFPLSPSSIDALTPAIPNQQSPLPTTTTGPIHLKTRMHKVTPYHNAFSRLSPLHSKTLNRSHNQCENQSNSNPIVPFPSKDELLSSLSSKENRFKRTADALQKSGLWDIAMKTGHLIKRNQELQKDLDEFKMDALNFLKSVIKNPENRDFIKSVLNTALNAGAAESKKSVMTVVVSAAAAVAAVSVSDSVVCNDSKVNSSSKASNKTASSTVGEKSPSDLSAPDSYCSLSKDELASENRTSVV